MKRTGTLATVQCRAFTVSIQFCTRSPLPYYLILCRTILSIRCSKYCTRTHSKTQLLVTSQNKGTNRLQPIFIQLKLKAPESVACTQTVPARRSHGHAVVMFALIHRFVLLSTYCGRTLQGNSYNLEGADVVWKATSMDDTHKNEFTGIEDETVVHSLQQAVVAQQMIANDYTNNWSPTGVKTSALHHP